MQLRLSMLCARPYGDVTPILVFSNRNAGSGVGRRVEEPRVSLRLGNSSKVSCILKTLPLLI